MDRVRRSWNVLVCGRGWRGAGGGSVRHGSRAEGRSGGGAVMVLTTRLIMFFFQAEDGIRDYKVTGVQTCALPISELNQHLPVLRDACARIHQQSSAQIVLAAAPHADLAKLRDAWPAGLPVRVIVGDRKSVV